VVVMARPTKSRCLYAQMAGRGTRALPGVVDGPPTAEARCEAIAASGKPQVEIIDFVGNSGRHKLVTTADLLGGKYADETVDRARKTVEAADGAPVDMSEALELAERDLHEEHEQARRAALKMRARYQVNTVDPFDVLGIEPRQERGWDKGRQPSEKMIALLAKNGIPTNGLSFAQAKQLIGTLMARWDTAKCTYKQAKLLAKYGYATNATFEQAGSIIDSIAKAGWKRPASAAKPETVKVY